MMRIALVDDNKHFLDILRKFLMDYFEKIGSSCYVEAFSDPVYFFDEVMEKDHFDLGLLDIEMPSINGVELAKKLRDNQKNMSVVFLTAHSELVRIGYEVKAFDFLSKVQIKEELPRVLDRFLREMEKRIGKVYTIATNARIEKISYKNIIYLYKSGQNVFFVQKNAETWERGALKDIINRLDDPMFMKIERGYVINLEHVVSVNTRNVVMSNGAEIRASRELISELKQRLLKYGVED